MSRWKHRFKVTVFDENSFSEIRVFRGTPRGWAWLVGGALTLVMGLTYLAVAQTQLREWVVPGYVATQTREDMAATRALADKGGLVAILQHEAALGGDPYTCGDYYLAHGGDIDATDPRTDSEHLTPLLFAIKRNDPRMVSYVIDHDADLKKRGGPNDVRPYGYAVFLALQNRSTNYNPVIAQLDKALKTSAAGTGGG